MPEEPAQNEDDPRELCIEGRNLSLAQKEDPTLLSDSMPSITVLPSALPEALRRTRQEARIALVLPLRLTSGSGDMIPAVLLDLSASGLLALVDGRSSLLLPPPPGARFTGEFFLDDLEIHQADLEVIQVTQRGSGLLALGCKLIEVQPGVTAALRARVAARPRAPRPQ